MPDTTAPASAGRHPHPAGKAYQIITALSMTVGRGRAARAIADAAGLESGDRVADIGCGPGTAVREAARRGATATGIDPTPPMLWLARRISAFRHTAQVTWLEGRAEALPLPDGAVTIVWALSSAHHWNNQAAGLNEIYRVLRPVGKMLLAERLVQPGASGHAAHGLTRAQADDLAQQMTAAGFANVHTEIRRAGRRTLVIIHGQRPPAAQAQPRAH
jgi:ubiquinone/menaquinone biosynthesis C-methylase UbiE